MGAIVKGDEIQRPPDINVKICSKEAVLAGSQDYPRASCLNREWAREAHESQDVFESRVRNNLPASEIPRAIYWYEK